jgi:hypothetical protein
VLTGILVARYQSRLILLQQAQDSRLLWTHAADPWQAQARDRVPSSRISMLVFAFLTIDVTLSWRCRVFFVYNILEHLTIKWCSILEANLAMQSIIAILISSRGRHSSNLSGSYNENIAVWAGTHLRLHFLSNFFLDLDIKRGIARIIAVIGLVLRDISSIYQLVGVPLSLSEHCYRFNTTNEPDLFFYICTIRASGDHITFIYIQKHLPVAILEILSGVHS